MRYILPGFSRLIRHSERKRGGLILHSFRVHTGNFLLTYLLTYPQTPLDWNFATAINGWLTGEARHNTVLTCSRVNRQCHRQYRCLWQLWTDRARCVHMSQRTARRCVEELKTDTEDTATSQGHPPSLLVVCPQHRQVLLPLKHQSINQSINTAYTIGTCYR